MTTEAATAAAEATRRQLDNDNTVVANYSAPPHPTAFGSINLLSQHYKIPSKKTSQILSSIDAYTLHREFHKPKKKNPFYIYQLRQQVQVDLIDISALSQSNDGFRNLVICIDTFSRKIWVRPTRSKAASEVLQVLKDMIAAMGQKPMAIFCDRGTELKNALFQEYLRGQGIKLLHPFSEQKAAHVERVNRTLQNMIYRYMSEMQTRTYIPVLQLIVESYNNRPHRSIDKLTPEEAELPQNAEQVLKALRKHYTSCMDPPGKKKKLKFKVGDIVRYKTGYGRGFRRGYEEQFSQELCSIDSINTRMAIPMYRIRSVDTGELIQGGWYGEELQARTSEEFKIERVLKRQVRSGIPHCLVKWIGFQTPSWIPESNITRVYGNEGVQGPSN